MPGIGDKPERAGNPRSSRGDPRAPRCRTDLARLSTTIPICAVVGKTPSLCAGQRVVHCDIRMISAVAEWVNPVVAGESIRRGIVTATGCVRQIRTRTIGIETRLARLRSCAVRGCSGLS